jgi:hypothetical protein
VQLLTSCIWTSTRAVAQAARLARPADRSAALLALVPHLPVDERLAVLAQALTAAAAITHENARAQALTALAPHLPPDQQPAVRAQALAAAAAITHEYDRASALTALAPHLPPDQQPAVQAQALTAAAAITDEYDRAQALIALAPYLPPELLTDAAQLAEATAWGSMAAIAARTAQLADINEIDAPLVLTILREGLSQPRRSECLGALSALGVQIGRIGGSTALVGCVEAIQRTATWWP